MGANPALVAEYARIRELWDSGHPDRKGIWAAYEDFLFEECLMILDERERVLAKLDAAVADCAEGESEYHFDDYFISDPGDDILPVIPLAISREEYAKRFNDILARMSAITQSKNSNYAVAEDAFQNFRLIEHVSNGRITTTDGLLTRMSDKFQRLANLLGGVENQHESVDDNCIDLAVYTIILLIHEESRRGTTATEESI